MISILGRFQDLNGQSPEQLGLISALCRGWTRDLPRSLPSWVCDFTHVAPASRSPRGVEQFGHSMGFFLFHCKAHIVYFLFYVSCITDGNLKAALQINNNLLWPSTASSCAPGTWFSLQAGISQSSQLFRELLLPVRKMKCRKVVPFRSTHYRSLIIWIFSLFISVLNRGEPGTRSPRQHSAAQQWNCPSLSCSSLGYLWHTSNFYNKRDSDLTDNSLLHCKPWFILQAGPGGKKS